MVAATVRDVGAFPGLEFPGIPWEFRGFPKISHDSLDFPGFPGIASDSLELPRFSYDS